MELDIDKLISWVSEGNPPEEEDVTALIDLVTPIFDSEPNLLKIQPPLKICGDSHGQLYDSLKMFELSPAAPDTRYLFLGDYVDRGAFSIELLTLLLAYKLKYPNDFFLLRGNHETIAVNSEYGFQAEIEAKYGKHTLFDKCNELFKSMPVAALVDNRLLCLHGGICPQLQTIEQIDEFDRHVEPDYTSLLSNIIWSDPSESIHKWQRSDRRSGYLFGEEQIAKFLADNHLQALVRSHEMVDGFRIQFDGKVITVWNAPNYCYYCGNNGSFMLVGNSAEEDSFVVFSPMPAERRRKPMQSDNPYFL
ncbi:Ser/Thr protein phosphatase, putative [Trichomonas vaginalis G3]|uniref:Serine/threonine-protein phosphatase n=1 Tax=Trichomonas vaginalis (strain ATCC PRA-98 / G3) TaxID=412133 RepID=A2ENB5_TRIV3|nr:phosphoprotein phosphatase protein [Trichomonas vaginalis G3]EAY05874.1 Ser/Thr protein phosphatase, putative [Trichomonas vaginalis G3]KAI5531683.1 phosphoprotein phosphatase protein [Trichomonas vaginalis G3]|eukprot:XP_001318097.1 Ser/Thr protein phosphatase [Trichomonas vaginalis G3]